MGDFIFGLLVAGILAALITFLVVDQGNYNHKPCSWFKAVNYSIGDTPLRCTSQLNK